jgi:hypothetical protein
MIARFGFGAQGQMSQGVCGKLRVPAFPSFRFDIISPLRTIREAAYEGNRLTDAPGERAQKIRIERHTFMGTVWTAAWLFTIGFLHLSFWKGVLAVVLWPYFLGVHFSALGQ